MVHGDNSGLILPPRVASVQVSVRREGRGGEEGRRGRGEGRGGEESNDHGAWRQRWPDTASQSG